MVSSEIFDLSGPLCHRENEVTRRDHLCPQKVPGIFGPLSSLSVTLVVSSKLKRGNRRIFIFMVGKYLQGHGPPPGP